jgi:hypothetical protein
MYNPMEVVALFYLIHHQEALMPVDESYREKQYFGVYNPVPG